MRPPPLPAPPKNPRLASLLNTSLPGLGLVYLGRPRTGFALAGAFLLCFLAAVALFLLGYARYTSLALSDQVLEGDNLEQIANAFPRAWLAGLATAGAAIYLISGILLRVAKRKLAPTRRVP